MYSTDKLVRPLRSASFGTGRINIAFIRRRSLRGDLKSFFEWCIKLGPSVFD